MAARKRGAGVAKAKRALPVALAKRAASLALARKERLVAEARGLIELVRRRKEQVAELFYDMGEALRRLKEREIVLALGYRSFDTLCDVEMQLSSSVANRLVEIVTRISRKDALAMGQTKAMALVDLALATPADDTPADLLRGGALTLPGGKVLDPKKASARAIERGAKAIRNARKDRPRRGRTTTAAERATAQALQAELHRRGLHRARVTAVATRPGATSELRIERVPADQLAALAAAIRALPKTSRAT